MLFGEENEPLKVKFEKYFLQNASLLHAIMYEWMNDIELLWSLLPGMFGSLKIRQFIFYDRTS